MSPSTSTPLERVSETVPATSQWSLRGAVRAAGFWLSVALPLLYVPLLWRGVTAETFLAFLGLLAANAVALVVGHDYGRE